MIVIYKNVALLLHKLLTHKETIDVDLGDFVMN
jgi:hypothetical protein